MTEKLRREIVMAGLDTELEAALKAMEASFHVRLISTFEPDLVWAPAESNATSWLAENNPDFDQFPVKGSDGAVGILLRQGDHKGKTVREAMQPLREGLIVSADMPIADLIPHLRDSHHRLVLRGGRIDGLVTQSDLLKLPVRMLLFGLVNHLELSLRALIRARIPMSDWRKFVGPSRRKEIDEDINTLKKARFEPDPLEFTNLSDVVKIIANQPFLPDGFSREMDVIRRLRNDIAHAKTYISSAGDVRKFVDCFNSIYHWIDHISRMLSNTK
jgi:CBS domain-containing protein